MSMLVIIGEATRVLQFHFLGCTQTQKCTVDKWVDQYQHLTYLMDLCFLMFELALPQRRIDGNDHGGESTFLSADPGRLNELPCDFGWSLSQGLAIANIQLFIFASGPGYITGRISADNPTIG